MAEEKLIIEIDEQGDVIVDLDGFKGKGCAAVMDVIEEALGPSARKNKPEYDIKTRDTGKTVTTVKTGA